MGFGKVCLFGGAAMALLSTSVAACAQDQQRRAYDLPAQDLGQALRSVVRTAGFQLIADAGALRGQRSRPLKGSFTVAEAVTRLLEGSGLSAEVSNRTVFVRGRSAPSPDAIVGAADDDSILVTGSRIRGARPASPIIVQSREEIESRGFTELGAFARSIPQNFSGGQNPGVVSSFQTGSENFNASSTMNLRGLGPDATLTLLNGHRLAHDATTQGIDISAIPLAAIERVDVVADGASALYGSDAVGGVANIVLRQDYSGFLTSVRVSGATDGGDMLHGASLVTGFRGQDNGLMVAGDYAKSTAIVAADRSYTQGLEPGMTLYPSQRQLSGIATFHQTLGPRFGLEIDGHVNQHKASTTIPFTASADVRQSGFISGTKVLSYSISPTLLMELPAAWRGELRVTRAGSDSDADVAIFAGGALFATNLVGYDNALWTGEVNAEGPLADLGGGAARLAVGGGFRSYSLDASIQQVTTTATRSILAYRDRQSVAYAFGEISLPFVGESNARPGLYRLSISGALRYERYKAMDGVTTPKLGLIYAPAEWLVFKGSWGRSFKAPTLSQRNQVPTGTLLPPSFFVPAPPTTRPILTLSGGNPDLGPERARTWTATAELSPWAGFSLGASYYNIAYRDRVVAPIFDIHQAFIGTLYQDLILFDPTASQVENAAQGLPLGVLNQTDGPFDPANVGAVVFGRVQNVASQKIHGIDLSGRYHVRAGDNDIRLSATASFLKSDQRLSANQPRLQMAGTLFRPPHWRWQGVASWRRGPLTVTAAASHIGGVEDRRTTTISKVAAFSAIDLGLHVEPDTGPFARFELQLFVSNLLNEKPAIIAAGPAQPPYDATNYPSIGRVLGITVTRPW